MPPAPVAHRARRDLLQRAHIPAPTGGLNGVDAALEMQPGFAMLKYNLLAAENGDRVRLGNREWCTGLTGAADNLVRKVMNFTGSTKSGTKNRVFATTSSGIWDVTSSSASPSKVHSFGTTTGEAGYGVSHVVVTSAGHFLLYCDEVNGLIVYTESTDTWAAVAMGGGATQISGGDPTKFVFVTVFKSRVWFLEKDTAKAWYMAAGSIYGAATQFDMGTKFRQGGDAVGLYNWSYDGGAGMDDRLVVISRGGDVLVWNGTDPASATTFSLAGVWTAPGIPAGRDVATNHGGDVLILTQMGILPLSKLVAGVKTEDTQQYSTYRIGPLFNQLMLSKGSLRGWSMKLHPEENALVVTAPTATSSATTQLVMSLGNLSWSQYRDLPIYSAETVGGQFYFGTTDGRVCVNTGYVDGVTLADPNTYSAIRWAAITSFQNLGRATQKKVELIKPTLLSEGATPTISVGAKYGFNLTELAAVSFVPSGGTSVWGSGVWGTAIWGGTYSGTQPYRGAVGSGAEVAMAFSGASVVRTVVVGFDIWFQEGAGL